MRSLILVDVLHLARDEPSWWLSVLDTSRLSVLDGSRSGWLLCHLEHLGRLRRLGFLGLDPEGFFLKRCRCFLFLRLRECLLCINGRIVVLLDGSWGSLGCKERGSLNSPVQIREFIRLYHKVLLGFVWPLDLARVEAFAHIATENGKDEKDDQVQGQSHDRKHSLPVFHLEINFPNGRFYSSLSSHLAASIPAELIAETSQLADDTWGFIVENAKG